MAEFDRTNTGIVSKNDRKTTDQHPDIKGQINVDGIEYWLDGWKKERKSDGAPFYSLTVKRKDAKPAGAAPVQSKQRPAKSVLDNYEDDGIPFRNPYRGGFLHVV